MTLSIESLLPFLQANGYLIIFILMLVEGPVITSISAFAASLGYLNIYVIILLSLLGNTIPDSLLFLVGRFARRKSVENFVGKFGLSNQRNKRIEQGLKKHAGKSLFLAKITPFMPVPGIMLAGFMKVPFKKFLFIDFLCNLILTTIFTTIGFYFGMAINSIFKYFKAGEYALLIIIPLGLIVYFLSKKITNALNKRIN